MEPASQFCRELQYQERPLSIFVRHQSTKGSFSEKSYGFIVSTLSSEFLENLKKCLVKISSQKFSSERSLLFYSILNFIITDCCSRSITRILFSSFQRIGILLSNYYFSPFLTNINPKTNQVQTITVMVQTKIACQSLVLLCASPGPQWYLSLYISITNIWTNKRFYNRISQYYIVGGAQSWCRTANRCSFGRFETRKWTNLFEISIWSNNFENYSIETARQTDLLHNFKWYHHNAVPWVWQANVIGHLHPLN